jgi:hypothetical protein
VNRLKASFVVPIVLCFGTSYLTARSQPSPQYPSAPGSSQSVTLPHGSKIELAVIRPVWAISAKTGDPFYAQVSFPAVADDRVAVPAGAYVLGTIQSVTRPTHRTNRAEIDVLFSKIIFADGYTLELPGAASAMDSGAPPGADAPGESLIAIRVQVSVANDLLLDNGAQVEMTLEAPLVLDAKEVAQDLPRERAPQLQLFKSATMCRFIPGTPGTTGTSDTVIPGTPGTPSITIPGGPGMPDITIPGTPATPPTVIPGTPSTPGAPARYCPPAPLVISSTPMAPSKPSATSQPVAAK